MVAAIEANLLDLEASGSREPAQPIGVSLAQGCIEIGLFVTSRGLLASDHVHIISDTEREIVVAPSSKNDVYKGSGHITEPGEIILTSPEGFFKYIARADKNPWQRTGLGLGSIAITRLGIHAPELTISYVEPETGIMIITKNSPVVL